MNKVLPSEHLDPPSESATAPVTPQYLFWSVPSFRLRDIQVMCWRSTALHRVNTIRLALNGLNTKSNVSERIASTAKLIQP